MPKPVPNVATIAGVDPSGGAGVLADVKAISALGAYACAVIAALTAQNTRAVTGVLPIAPEFVALQIDTLLADVRIDAVKIGMLGEAPVIAAVGERLAHWKAERVVLDPVMVAKSGDALLAKEAVGVLRETLLPLAFIITPNLPEAGVLLDARAPDSVKEMFRAAERLHALMGSGERWVWLDTKNTHGTGCTLSAALAALLPQRPDVPTAARHAKAYLTQALRHADELKVGRGHGPVHHFHALWSPAPEGRPGGP
jgi:hydroxymethylpyrimidine/phosphomethylpyrimidine kinase